jgi:hypothetical protein
MNSGSNWGDVDGISSTLEKNFTFDNTVLLIGATDIITQSTGANGSLSRVSSGRIICDVRMDADDDGSGRFIPRRPGKTLWYESNRKGTGGRTVLFNLQAGPQ